MKHSSAILMIFIILMTIVASCQTTPVLTAYPPSTAFTLTQINTTAPLTTTVQGGVSTLTGTVTKTNTITSPVTLPTTSSSLPYSSTTKTNIIIDHTNWDWYNNQPQQVFERVAALRIFFSHASVGEKIMNGFDALNSANPIKYPLGQIVADANPPVTTTNGIIYQYYEGNPGWSQKISDFKAHVNSGWHDTKVDIAMNKFCYIDAYLPGVDWTIYRDSMVALEAQYPNTKFVYMTMPLLTVDDGVGVQRAQFNQAMRDWIATQNGKLLFDIADIEAWSPSGEHQTFTYNGTAYELAYSAYTSDGGHPNAEGSQRLAIGLYSLFGREIDSMYKSL